MADNTTETTSSPVARTLRSVVTLPAPSAGFLGEAHTAVEVIAPTMLVDTDPFVLLMDDRLDLGPGARTAGGPHPHAGLETVTFFIEGNLADKHEGDTTPGDAQWMTAGSGLIHGENSVAEGKHRILQLWVRLPSGVRNAPPRVQLLRKTALPVRREEGVTARLYSGATGGLRSSTKNHAPITMVDIALEKRASFTQTLPASYNGFLYVLEGEVHVGAQTVRLGDVAWLDRPTELTRANRSTNDDDDTTLTIVAGDSPARVMLYAGQPQREPLVHYGPFIGGSEADLMRAFSDYRAGRFPRLSQLAAT